MTDSLSQIDHEDCESGDPFEILRALHRKEKKLLKEKTLAMKKAAKSGNKQKQKAVGIEVENLELEMAARHKEELAELEARVSESKECSASLVVRDAPKDDMGESLEHGFYKQLAISSRKKKKQAKQEHAIRCMQEAVQEDIANAATSLRVTEMVALQKILDERGLIIVHIAPDGDCLYNAVAHQLSQIKGFEQVTGKDMRRRAAKYLREHKDDFIPFLADESGEPLDGFEFEKYCHGVENESANGGVWGGEPELNALSHSLERRIELIQPTGLPTIFGEEFTVTPLIIVYHRHEYQLGAHYNSTKPRNALC